MPADPATARGAAPRRARAGFRQAAALVSDRIRSAGESRGFAVTRLLTHWAEIAGPDIAAHARPVKIGYRRDGLGATLTLLTTGAAAPLVQMQVPQIRERVNACYGYNAIARIALTQTAPTGFAEGQADFTPAPKSRKAGPASPAPATPETRARAADIAAGVQDSGLRDALESLAQNVLARGSRSGSTKGKDDPNG
jgi:hypothetical protein